MIKIEYKTYSNKEYEMPVFAHGETGKWIIVDGLKELKHVKAIRVNGEEIWTRSETK